MGEANLSSQESPETCCMDFRESLLILTGLIILVQLTLQIVTVICYYIWYQVGSLFSKAPKQTHTSRTRRAHYQLPSEQLSQQDLPRRHRRSKSSSPCRRYMYCSLEPLRVTLDTQQDESYPLDEHPQSTRHPPPNYNRYFNCECEWRPRPHPVSDPPGYHVIRYKDVACGTSDTMLKTGGNALECQGGPPGVGTNDPFPRVQVGETPFHSTAHDPDYSQVVGLTRSRRPAKVYIYPVHPQTPPGSRSTSPERSQRRRNTPVTTAEELRGSYEPRELRRKVREAEEQLGLSSIPRYRSMAANTGRVQSLTPQQADPKQRFYMTEPLNSTPAQDWVYRSLK